MPRTRLLAPPRPIACCLRIDKWLRPALALAMIGSCLALPPAACAQAEAAVTVRPLSAGDPDAPLIRAWLEKRKPGGLPPDLKTIAVSEPAEIVAPSLQGLFPEWRFFRVTWSEEYTRKGEKYKKQNGIVDSNIFETISFGVNRGSRRLIPFFDSGNCESFAELLTADKVEIRSFDRAQAVWAAFCDLHDKQWHSRASDWPDAAHWRLGGTVIGEYRYYYEVLLDASGIAVAGGLKADRVE